MDLQGYKENRWWYYGGTNRKPNPFQLSAGAGKFVYSDVITELLPGEYFKFFVNIRSINGISDYANVLEILVVKAGTNLRSGHAWVLKYSYTNQSFDSYEQKLEGKYLDVTYPTNLIKPIGKLNELILWFRPQKKENKRGVYLGINDENLQAGFSIGEDAKYSVYSRVVGITADFYGK